MDDYAKLLVPKYTMQRKQIGNFTFKMFILCIVNDLQVLTVPTNAQFYCYVFHTYLAPTHFGLSAIIRELTL